MANGEYDTTPFTTYIAPNTSGTYLGVPVTVAGTNDLQKLRLEITELKANVFHLNRLVLQQAEAIEALTVEEYRVHDDDAEVFVASNRASIQVMSRTVTWSELRKMWTEKAFTLWQNRKGKK